MSLRLKSWNLLLCFKDVSESEILNDRVQGIEVQFENLVANCLKSRFPCKKDFKVDCEISIQKLHSNLYLCLRICR